MKKITLKKIENNSKLCMMNFILKLYIQNNLSNTITCKNEFFFIIYLFLFLFLYLILEFEYRKEKMKTQYITF